MPNLYFLRPSAQPNFIEIIFQFTPHKPGKQVVQLPIWRPGRYQAQNFAKNIPVLKAYSEGVPIPISKIASSTWTLEASEPVEIRYSYYANQPDAGGSVIENDLIYINFINCLLYVKGRENERCEIHIEKPAGWQSICTFKNGAKYRELVDSPYIAAPAIFQHKWKCNGVKFAIDVVGSRQALTKKLIDAYEKFTQTQLDWMGHFPVKEYHYMLWVCPSPYYHGVEHTKSTMMVMGPPDRDAYEDLIGLGSHELFHVWNIATIRPAELFPYAYERETPFSTGWVVEGITTYLGDWFLYESGVWTRQEYLAGLLGNLKLHFDRDGQAQQSLEESSIDLWLDGYGASLPNKRVSIYYKGAVVALALDLKLQARNGKSLRDVMLAMNAEFGQLKKGYTKDDFIRICEEIYGDSLQDFFRDYVERSTDITTDLQETLAKLGLKFEHDIAKGWVLNEKNVI
ncbi:M61 family peptidase [Aquirufa sp.]|jgi:predicted metalloprotease with PDZ domain|uniref:M61 family metallopeptidase n=1 Tax=Aquirufa sp. TaxID=2676249 RepID=UPI00378371E7